MVGQAIRLPVFCGAATQGSQIALPGRPTIFKPMGRRVPAPAAALLRRRPRIPEAAETVTAAAALVAD